MEVPLLAVAVVLPCCEGAVARGCCCAVVLLAAFVVLPCFGGAVAS